jgi:predicted MFS family arabinose efflux permease
MMACFAAGQALSAMSIARRWVLPRRSMLILYASTIWAATMIAFAFSTSYHLTLFILFVMGTAVPLWITSISTILQTQTEKPMLGRVMSVYAMSMQIGMVGSFVGAWLRQLIGNDWMLLLAGSTFAILNFLIILPSRELRRI